MLTWLERKVPPVAVTLILALAMWWFADRLPGVGWPAAILRPLAAACAIAGLTLGWLGVAAFRRARTTVTPIAVESASSLVAVGVYRFTRNPMYAGMALMLTGWAIWLAVPALLLGPAALVLYLSRFQIIPEERALRAKFGSAYDVYQRRVRRWV